MSIFADGDLDAKLKAVAMDRYDDGSAYRPHPLMHLITGEERFRPTWRSQLAARWYRARLWIARTILRVDTGDNE